LTLPVEEAVVRLIAKMTGIQREELVPTARLFHDLGVSDEDAIMLLIAIAQEFKVVRTGFIKQVLRWRWAGNTRLLLTVGDLIAVAKARSMEPILRG
jgi:hypothetical protein